MARKKIVILDSDAQFVEQARGALQADFAVTVVSTKRDGMRTVTQDMPDAVIAGFVEMRGDAFEVCREMRSDPATSGIPVLIVDVALKDYLRKGWRRQEVLATNAAGYLVRPLQAEELAREVEAICRGDTGKPAGAEVLEEQVEAALRRVREVEKILTK